MPVLHLLCGKIAAGKSTLAQSLGDAPQTLLISEDRWLAALFGDQMADIADYLRCSARLRAVMADHVAALLRQGLSVVLDFPANTPATRAWMKELIDRTGADHCLHWLDVSDAVCKARLHRRNGAGEHDFSVTDAQFDAITRHFCPPEPDEGFMVVRYGAEQG